MANPSFAKAAGRRIGPLTALVEEAERCGLVLAEGFMYRHHPTTARIAELVSSGALGVPLAARGALGFTLADPADIRARPELSGGALLDLGCYVTDGLCRLYGAAAERVEGLRMIGGSGTDEHNFGRAGVPRRRDRHAGLLVPAALD